jgi:hypothetical protein
MFWIGLIIGIIVWQFASLIFCFLWQEDEDKYVMATTGLVGGLCLAVIKVVDKIKAAYGQYNYKAALVDSEGKLCYCESREADDYIQSNQYFWAFYLRDKYVIEDGWRRQDCWVGKISLRYTPVKVLRAEGAYRLPNRKDTTDEEA